MALNPGDVVDQKYRILRLLGEGGMGAVYEGENTRIHRRVAIKVLHASVAGSQDAVQRFEREAQAAGRIGSEHIVEVLDLGHLADGERYMVMEFLDGQSLSERIETRGRLAPQTVAPIIVQLLEGLRAAHEAGIIHRDLKPDNVFLLASRSSQKDFVKILDFGISKFNALGGEFSMTRTGAVMGTPYYMSPEQAKGNRDVDLRADLYAVGVILYECLAGEVPFSAESFNELLFKIVLESPVPLTQRVPGLDPAFSALVEKAMARDPAARFQTADELQQALKSWLANAPAVTDSTLAQGTPRVVAQASALQGSVAAGGSVLQASALQGSIAQSSGLQSSVTQGSSAGVGSSPDLGESALTSSGVTEAAPETPGAEGKSPGLRTQGTWAASGEFGAKKGAPRVAIFAAAALAVLALGGGGLYVVTSSGEAEEQARIAAQQAEEAKAAAAREAEELRLEAERARAEADRAHAERARLEAEASKSVAEQQRLEAERAAAEKLAQEKEEAARAARAAAARHKAASSPPPAAKAPPPSSPASAGRVIRTDL